MSEKIILLIAGAALSLAGAIVAKLFDLYLQHRKVFQLEQALLEELQDIKERLFLICRSYERALQIYALDGVTPEVPLRLANPIFSKHYPDVTLKLGASQRISFALIHSYVDAINDGIDLMADREIRPSGQLTRKRLNAWGNFVKAQYTNAAMAYWHVNYHLSNRELPLLGGEGTPEHTAMLASRKKSVEHIDKLIAATRQNLTRDDFGELE